MTEETLLKNSLTINNSIITLGDTTDSGKGRHFKSRFIQPGLAGYPGQFGNALIKKENLDKFVYTLRNKPVTINHKDNIGDDDKVGEVLNVWYNPEDGWYWCDGIITDETAINLINDKNWSVSCSYDFTKYDDEGGTENNIPYDIEFLDGEFNHLAIVDNPRYEGANIVFNSKEVTTQSFKEQFVDAFYEALAEVIAENCVNNGKWITLKPHGNKSKGTPIYVEDDETIKEAIKDLRQERNSHKQAISELKYEQRSMKDMFSISKGKKGFKSTLVDPIGYEFETKTRSFNRLLQDMKNYLKTSVVEIPQEVIDEFENRAENTIMEIDNYSDAEEKWGKFWVAIDNMISYARMNERIKTRNF